MTLIRKQRLRGEILIKREVAGASKPRADKLPPIAKIYGCTVDELLDDKTAENEE